MRIPGLLRYAVQGIALILGFAASLPAFAENCGANGERACRIDERIPSCDLNLAEGGGRCVRPACGAEGQRGCLPAERMKFDFVLKLPVPQVCDENLKHDLFRNVCSHPNCGYEGRNACPITERLPSCDVNLVEQAGSCFHPPLCGKLGQPPCDVLLRGPFHQCDADLVIRLGQCQRAGTPDATGGNSGSNTHAAVPVGTSSGTPPPPPGGNVHPAVPVGTSGNTGTPPPPQGGTVHAAVPVGTSSSTPPPPPPPGGNVHPAVPVGTSVNTGTPPPPSSGGSPGTAPPQSAGGMEADTDHMGYDIYGFPMTRADPAACQATCNAHAQCVAWTFVKPGIKGPQPFCFLKNGVAPPSRNTCCISGVKPR